LRLRKILVERVTVVKFRVDSRGSNSTGCFRIKVRTDAAVVPRKHIPVHLIHLAWFMNTTGSLKRI